MTDDTDRADSRADQGTDDELIRRWKSGEQRAASLLVGRHANSVARFVTSLGVQDDVEDVVQDTFVRAFASIDGFRGDSQLRTWLFTIASRLVLDARRSERRRGEQVEVQDGDARTDFDPLDAMVADEAERRMLGAVACLTPTQRQVFGLRVGEGMSYREIADAVGTTEGAARVHYHNAMRAIKELLDD